MDITLSLDENLLERARRRLHAVGKTVDQELCEHLQNIAGDGNDQLEGDLQGFLQRVGQGDSQGWKWNREELYEERTRWPRE